MKNKRVKKGRKDRRLQRAMKRYWFFVAFFDRMIRGLKIEGGVGGDLDG